MTSPKPNRFHYFIPDDLPVHQIVLNAMICVFITCLVIANLTGGYLFSFNLGGTPVLLSAGIIPFPVTFILTDLLNEFYGKRMARFVTLLGFTMSVLVYLILIVAEQLPTDLRSPWTQSEFHRFAHLYTQIFSASLTAYLVGQLLDIQVFQWFRERTGSRMIWLRAQGSTVISQLFDSFIVTSIAFWGSLSWSSMVQLALSNYSLKFMIVVLITPLLYLGHLGLKQLLRLKVSVSVEPTEV